VGFNYEGLLSTKDMRLGVMMKKDLIFKGLSVFLFTVAVQTVVEAAAPACKGPNKNDPGCEEAAVVPVVVDSVTVDWVNEKLIVRGSGFVVSTSFLLGSSAIPLVTTNVTDTQLDIPFNADLAAEVQSQGNYNLVVDGAVQLSVFIESQIIDPAATGCPCESDWASELGVYWGSPADSAACLEILGPSTNDIADISGTILSVPGDSTAYPQYPIGASYYPGKPDDSVCRLVQVNADASPVDLVNQRINETQQTACAAALKDNVCASVTTLP
jgi:hypothetical protein